MPPDDLSPPAEAGPRKQPRDTRRLQLIEATIRTLARSGFARMTLAEVTRAAGLSQGLANFHFASKERLLTETLLFLAEEYRLNWTGALAAAGSAPAAQLEALLRADFHPAICTPERLAAWCSFWGEAQSRPIYQERCGANDDTYIATLEGIVSRLMAEGGYAGNPQRVARVLRNSVEGTWLDMMTMTAPYGREEAQATVLTCASLIFPRHFGPEGRLVA